MSIFDALAAMMLLYAFGWPTSFGRLLGKIAAGFREGGAR